MSRDHIEFDIDETECGHDMYDDIRALDDHFNRLAARCSDMEKRIEALEREMYDAARHTHAAPAGAMPDAIKALYDRTDREFERAERNHTTLTAEMVSPPAFGLFADEDGECVSDTARNLVEQYHQESEL